MPGVHCVAVEVQPAAAAPRSGLPAPTLTSRCFEATDRTTARHPAGRRPGGAHDERTYADRDHRGTGREQARRPPQGRQHHRGRHTQAHPARREHRRPRRPRPPAHEIGRPDSGRGLARRLLRAGPRTGEAVSGARSRRGTSSRGRTTRGARKAGPLRAAITGRICADLAQTGPARCPGFSGPRAISRGTPAPRRRRPRPTWPRKRPGTPTAPVHHPGVPAVLLHVWSGRSQNRTCQRPPCHTQRGPPVAHAPTATTR